MNCRQAQDHLFAKRDASRASNPAAGELADHLAECPACRRLQAGLTTALDDWRHQVATVAVPDPQTEWHAVRRRLRQEQAGAPVARSAWARLLRVAAPLTAVAAIAFLVWPARTSNQPANLDSTTTVAATSREAPAAADGADGSWPEMEQHFAFTAHAEYVETDNEEASPFVYVDDESGWLIVWASDPPDAASI